ncbi:MAG: AgmX/PglI C-terminal domain-containing protein [Enhygromyxa sp.]
MGRSQGLQRALILLALAGFGCKAPREPAGEPPPFDVQLLYEGPLELTSGAVELPRVLPLDVRSDAIHVGDADASLVFGRDGSTEVVSYPLGVPLRVSGHEYLLVWSQQHTPSERRIFAAGSGETNRRWPVLDYRHEDAVGEPIVLDDRVAIVTRHGIVHARVYQPEPKVLPLTQTPVGPISSDGKLLVWIARQGEHEFVMSSDAGFEAAVVEHEQHRSQAELVGAARVTSSLVFASIDQAGGRSELVVRRKHPDGSLVELLRRPPPDDKLRLLADGRQAWLYTAGNLWWIGPDSHAKITKFDARPSAIAADDGVLVWYSDDELHLAGLPTIEFHQPLRPQVAVGGDDNDVWTGLTGDLTTADLRGSKATPRGRVVLAKHEVDGPLDAGIVRRVVRAHGNEIRSCYRAGLEREPSLAGTIELEFVIDGGGRVARVEDRTGDDFADHEVSGCVAQAMRRWKFPKPQGGASVTVRYPIELAPGE